MDAASKRSKLINSRKNIEARRGRETEYVKITKEELAACREITKALSNLDAVVPRSLMYATGLSSLLPVDVIRKVRTIMRRASQLNMTITAYVSGACVVSRITTIPKPTLDFVAGLWVYEALKTKEHIYMISRSPMMADHTRQKMHQANIEQLRIIDEALRNIENLLSNGATRINSPFLNGPLKGGNNRETAVAWMLANRNTLHPVILFTCPEIIFMWKEQGDKFNGETYAQALLRSQEALAVFKSTNIVPNALQRLQGLRKALANVNRLRNRVTTHLHAF